MIFCLQTHLSYYFFGVKQNDFVKNGEFSYEITPIRGAIQRKNSKKQTFMQIIEI